MAVVKQEQSCNEDSTSIDDNLTDSATNCANLVQPESIYFTHRDSNRRRGQVRGTVSRNPDGNCESFNCNVRNICYRIGDYCYVESDRPDQPYFIGLIQYFEKGKRDNLFVSLQWFYRAEDISEIAYHLLVQDRNIENKSGQVLITDNPVIRNRELFICDTTYTYPISSLRGTCKVVHYAEFVNAQCFSPSQDSFFYILGYNPETRRLANTQGEIRVGPSHQARLPEYKPNVKPADMPEKCEPLEEIQWMPGLAVDCDLMIYLQAARSMAAFAGMCDGGSPDDGCMAACRDDTTMNAMNMLHSCRYNTGKALQALVKNPVPVGINKKWLEDEQKRFLKGLRQYGKNFFKIRKELLPHKETGDLVEFYYLWKKTPAASNARPHRRHRRQNVLRRIRTGTRGNNRQNNEYMDLSSASEEENDSDDSDSRDMSGYACHHCFTTTSKDWHHAGKGRTLLCTECRLFFKKYGELRPLLEPREPPAFMFKPIKDEDSNSTSSTPVNGKHGMRTRRCKENSNSLKTRQRSSRPGSAASPDIDSSKLGRKSPSTGSTSSNSSSDKSEKVKKKIHIKKEAESPSKAKKRAREDKTTPTSELDTEDVEKDSSPVKKCKVKTEPRSESPSESATTATESGSISNDDDQAGDRSSSPSSSESTPSSPNNNQQSSPTETDTPEEETTLENLPDMSVEEPTPLPSATPLPAVTAPPPLAPVPEPVPVSPFLSRMPPVSSSNTPEEAAPIIKQEKTSPALSISPPPVLLPIIKTEPASPEKPNNSNESAVEMPPILKIKQEPGLASSPTLIPAVVSSVPRTSPQPPVITSSPIDTSLNTHKPSLPPLICSSYHHNLLPTVIRSIETKETPVVPVAPSILRENQRLTEHLPTSATSHIPLMMPSQKPFPGMLAPSSIKLEPQDAPTSQPIPIQASSSITLPSTTSRLPITKPIATVAASVSQQRISSPASAVSSMKSSSPHASKSNAMITTCAPSGTMSSTLVPSNIPATSSSPFSLHSFPPHVPLPPSYGHGLPHGAVGHGLPHSAMHSMHPFSGYPYHHLPGYPAPHPSLHPPVPPRPPSTATSSCNSSIMSTSPSVSSHALPDPEPPKVYSSTSVAKSQSSVILGHSSTTSSNSIPPKEIGSTVDDPVTVEDDDDDDLVAISHEPEPEPKIDNSECHRSQSAIFLKYWNRGNFNSCCRTDLTFKPVPDSKLARKREERIRKHSERERAEKARVKTPTSCKTPISDHKPLKEEPMMTPHGNSFDRHTPHRISSGVSHDTPALRQLSEYARPHTAFSPNVPRSTPGSYPTSSMPGPSTGIIAPYGIGGMDPVLHYQLSSGVYGPGARERLEMEFEREKREREMREREMRERELHEKLKAEMEYKPTTSLAGRFPPGGLPFGASPLDPHWIELQRRYAAAAGLGPCGPPTSLPQNPFGMHPGIHGVAGNMIDRERLAALQGIPGGIPSAEYERMHADRMAALAAAAANDPVLRLQLAAAGAAGLTPSGLPPSSSAEMHSHAHTHAHAHTHLHLHPHELSPSVPPYPPLGPGEGCPPNAPGGAHPLLPPSAGSFPRPGFPIGRDPGMFHIGGNPGGLRPTYEDQLAHQLSAQQEHLQRQLMMERERFPPPGAHLPPHIMAHHEELFRQQQAREQEMKMKLRTLEEAARGNRSYDGSMGGSSGGAGGVMDRT